MLKISRIIFNSLRNRKNNAHFQWKHISVTLNLENKSAMSRKVYTDILDVLMNHQTWECKHAEFNITYVHFVSLQSSLIKLGNELQQRMQDRGLRGHEHRHMSNNEILTSWCKKCLFLQYWLIDQSCTKKGLKMLIEKLVSEHSELTINRCQHLYLQYKCGSHTDGGTRYTSSLLLTERTFYSPPTQVTAIVQTLISLCTWHREHSHTLHLLTVIVCYGR